MIDLIVFISLWLTFLVVLLTVFFSSYAFMRVMQIDKELDSFMRKKK